MRPHRAPADHDDEHRLPNEEPLIWLVDDDDRAALVGIWPRSPVQSEKWPLLRFHGLDSRAVVPLKNTSIVVLGNFNPAIFQPEWFLRHDLLPADEVEAATARPGSTTVPLIVTSDLCQIPFRSTFLQVRADRWLLSTERPDWSTDLGGIASSVFTHLPETPVRTVGLNVIEHRPPASGTAAEVIESWAPLRALGEAVGTAPWLGAKVRSQWEEFRVMVQLEPSEVRKGELYLLQNYEATLESAASLAGVLGRWRDVLDRARLLSEKLTRAAR